MIGLFLAEGFEEVEAVIPTDFLRRADLDVRLVGIGGKRIKGSHGIVLEADVSIEELGEVPEHIIIPGGMPGAENVAGSDAALSLVRRVYDNGGTVAAICAAPAVVLQKAGILRGKRVTCYPGFEDRFEGCTFVEDRVVVDGNVVTSRAPGTAAELAIKLVELLKSKEQARAIFQSTLQR